MKRCASGGIIRSSLATRDQLGFAFQAGWLFGALTASSPQGTWESAMNAARSGSTSPAKEVGNLALSSSRKPSCGGRIGGAGALGGIRSLMRDSTDSPLSGIQPAMYTSPTTLGSLPASVITA